MVLGIQHKRVRWWTVNFLAQNGRSMIGHIDGKFIATFDMPAAATCGESPTLGVFSFLRFVSDTMLREISRSFEVPADR